MTQDQSKPTLEKMWKFIGDILAPLGKMPDKASMDYNQVLELYSSLATADMMFRELVQIAIFKKETTGIKNAS
ncbi:MAG: hypothetical protein KGI27_02315 [Thaumarchaeota archaeon]|nr:hypothetical protein [Nitrososphaerota archaeon]